MGRREELTSSIATNKSIFPSVNNSDVSITDKFHLAVCQTEVLDFDIFFLSI